MAIECAYSFGDLYKAAYNKEPERDALLSLYALPQKEKNEVVRGWARRAGWEIKERVGMDGVAYLAFAPSFNGEKGVG